MVLSSSFGYWLSVWVMGQNFSWISPWQLTGRQSAASAKWPVSPPASSAPSPASAVANVMTTGTFSIPLMKPHGVPKTRLRGALRLCLLRRSDHPPSMGAARPCQGGIPRRGLPDGRRICAAPAILFYVGPFFGSGPILRRSARASALSRKRTKFR